ncbi:MAG: hypothetical protein Kow002_15770 [Anaerolineales bacterium]
MRKLLFLTVCLLVAISSLVPQSPILAEPASQSSPNDLIAAVNALRIANGLPPYNPHPILMQIAQSHADYMAATGSVTHYSADGSRPFQRALNAGYPVAGDLSLGGFFSENIVAGRFTADRAVEIWQGDAPHLNTMLSSNLQDVGAGVTKVGDFIYYVIDAGLASNAPVQYTPNSPNVTPGVPPDVSQFIVPVVTSTPDENGLVYHEVQSGQSLWAIAIAYETKIDEIRRLNNLPGDAAIYPGDRLLVREEATPTADVGTTTASPVASQATNTLLPESTATFQAVEAVKSTSTPARQPVSAGGNSAGVVIGIVLAVLLVAGLLTWASASRKV